MWSERKIDSSIKTEVADAVKQAAQDKEPDLIELASDVYARNLEGNLRNVLHRDLKHSSVGIRLVAEGVAKATPTSQIKDTSQGEIQEPSSPAK